MITDLEKQSIFKVLNYYYTSTMFNLYNLKPTFNKVYHNNDNFKDRLYKENTRIFFRYAITLKNNEFVNCINNEFELFCAYNDINNEIKTNWLKHTYNFIINKNSLSGFIDKPTTVLFIKWYKETIQTIDNKQPKQTEAVKTKNEFKDFFNTNVSVEVIEKIQDDFKEYYGKKMAMLIYLLETEFKLITYSLDSKTDSRKHFVDSLNKSNTNMQPINKSFVPYNYRLDITNFEKNKDFVRIKEKLQETIK